ncbi:transient receptor potential cation channel subfamily M member-like 2 isoform X1 [Clavelina lepadiformis]|uniref:transient receptor potential cation channel subfamily M member-like 2 isoform X1 n=2 Tax=Clavelina lepadiformis TaxID=159417 RepID=UPI004041F5DC
MATFNQEKTNFHFWELRNRESHRYETTNILELDDDFDTANFFSVIKEKWLLSEHKPAIFLSATESTQRVTKIYQECFQSIASLVEETDSWLIIDGDGESLCHTPCKCSVHQKVVTICIKCCNHHIEKSNLICLNGVSQEKANDVYLNIRQNIAQVDEHHSHFVLINDEIYGNTLKSNVLKCIFENEDLLSVFVLFNGDCSTIENVSQALKSGMPVVIVEGSGGAADLLATLCKFNLFDESSIQMAILRFFSTMIKNHDVGLLDCIRFCLEKKSLIALYQPSFINPQSNSLDMVIISSLLNEQIPRQRLEHTKEELKRILLCSLMENNVKAAQLYVSAGVVLSEDDLLALYDSGLDELHFFKAWVTHYCSTVDKKQYCDIKQMLLPQLISWDFKQENTDKIDMTFELFIWCIVMNRSELSHFFFNRISEKLSAAIGATEMLKSMILMENNNGKKDLMQCHAKEYKSLSLGILQECYADSASKTGDLLIRKRDEWGGLTLLQISVDEEDIINFDDQQQEDIVSQKAVRYLLNKIWYGIDGVNGKNATIHTLVFYLFILSMIAFLPVICCCLTVVILFDETNSEGSTSGIDNHNHAFAADTTTESYSTTNLHGNNNQVHPADHSSNKLHSSHGQSLTMHTEDSKYVEAANLSILDKGWEVIQSPFAKYQINAAATIAFMWLYGYALLFNYFDSISTFDYVLMGWFASLFLEEMYEIYNHDKRGTISKKLNLSRSKLGNAWQKLFHYWSDRWNIIDIAAIIVYFVSLGLKISSVDASRVIATVAFVLYCVRSLQFFTINKKIGPKLIMIREMILDFLYFCFILLVFFVAYGVTAQSILYPNQTDAWPTIEQFLFRSFWHLYGELFLPEIDYDSTTGEYTCTNDAALIVAGNRPCPQQQAVVKYITALYMLLVNILLLNLLIAILNNTYANIEKKVDRIWNYQRFELIEEYAIVKSPLPPPLSILGYIYKGWCGKDDHIFKRKFKDCELQNLEEFERMRSNDYMSKLNEEKRNSLDSKIQVLHEKCKHLTVSVTALTETVNDFTGTYSAFHATLE